MLGENIMEYYLKDKYEKKYLRYLNKRYGKKRVMVFKNK